MEHIVRERDYHDQFARITYHLKIYLHFMSLVKMTNVLVIQGI